MGRYVSSGSSGVGGSSATPALTTTVTTGEAVTQGQVAVIAADGLAYYALDPSNLANAVRQVYSPAPAANVFLNPSPIIPQGASSGANTSNNSSSNMGINSMGGAPLSNGNFVVAWQDLSSLIIKFAIFDGGGAQQGASFSVGNSAPTDTSQFNLSVCALTGGGFVIAYGLNIAPWAQYAVYDNSGTVVKARTTVDVAITGIVSTTVKAVALSNGGFALCYVGTGTTACFGIYTAAGVLSVGPTTIDSGGCYFIEAASFTAAQGGGFVVAYATSGSGTKVKKYTNAGAVAVATFGTGGGNYAYSHVCTTSTGGFAVAVYASGVKAQIFNAAGAYLGAASLGNTQSGTYMFMVVGLSNGNVGLASIGNSGNNTIGIFNGATAEMVALVPNTTFPMNYNSNTVFNMLPNHYGGLSIFYGGGGGGQYSAGFDGKGNLVDAVKTPPTRYQQSGSMPPVFFAIPSGTAKGDIAVYMNGGTLSIGIVNFYQQKITPIGVFAASAAAGASVPVQYTGNATLATGFAFPYSVDATLGSPPGQRMNIVGNSVTLNGIQPAERIPRNIS